MRLQKLNAVLDEGEDSEKAGSHSGSRFADHGPSYRPRDGSVSPEDSATAPFGPVIGTTC